MIKDDIKKLKEMDLYTVMLFTLYKMMSVPEFSSISELAYVLDKENFLNLCEYFGGTTIRIPTKDELKDLVYALLLYQYTKIDNIPYDKAVQLIGHESKDLRSVKKNYTAVCNVLEDYDFVPRNKVK